MLHHPLGNCQLRKSVVLKGDLALGLWGRISSDAPWGQETELSYSAYEVCEEAPGKQRGLAKKETGPRERWTRGLLCLGKTVLPAAFHHGEGGPEVASVGLAVHGLLPWASFN